MDSGWFCSRKERYLTLGAHGSPLGKDTLSAGRWGTGRGITSSLSRGNVSVSMELSLSSLSSSSSRESSGLYGSFSLKASRLSCLINACHGARQRRSLEATCGTQVDSLTTHLQSARPTLCSRRARFCCCSMRSDAEAGGEAALMLRMTRMLSSGRGGRPSSSRWWTFMFWSCSKPPSVN